MTSIFVRIDLDEYISKRLEFSSDEWIDLLVNTCGTQSQELSFTSISDFILYWAI
jgi:predicted ATP-dependent Lon-type protease